MYPKRTTRSRVGNPPAATDSNNILNANVNVGFSDTEGDTELNTECDTEFDTENEVDPRGEINSTNEVDANNGNGVSKSNGEKKHVAKPTRQPTTETSKLEPNISPLRPIGTVYESTMLYDFAQQMADSLYRFLIVLIKLSAAYGAQTQ
ncbi:hypothetical protein N7523_005596 [Penicillium sp. IBT 18751x]|nr:hypothetical protein N7523_005817 [Penicillium sp. IBT 18751x]KAJ6117845.1 hypothetical protein N7523_005596 [Penicillium sp. IBT 18751x]